MPVPNIKLNSGREMPQVGFGLWKVDNPIAPDVVYEAIKAGYRLFDGACGMLQSLVFSLRQCAVSSSQPPRAMSGVEEGLRCCVFGQNNKFYPAPSHHTPLWPDPHSAPLQLAPQSTAKT